MNKFGIFLAAATALTLATVSAGAQPREPGARSFKVEYADLDLASPAGQAVLQKRLRAAASRLCLDHGVHPLREQIAQRQCLNETISAAQPRLAEIVSRRGRTTFAAGDSTAATVR
jgi:UrcA family protein